MKNNINLFFPVSFAIILTAKASAIIESSSSSGFILLPSVCFKIPFYCLFLFVVCFRDYSVTTASARVVCVISTEFIIKCMHNWCHRRLLRWHRTHHQMRYAMGEREREKGKEQFTFYFAHVWNPAATKSSSHLTHMLRWCPFPVSLCVSARPRSSIVSFLRN